MASHPITEVSAEEYLALDRAAEVRSEYFDGEMIAMSGDTIRHARIAGNILAQLHMALEGSGCEAFNSDFRVRVSSRMYAYPDISVVCGEPMLADERQDILLNPRVIIQVLSPSTEHYDRGVKFQNYRSIESLQDYILVAQNQVRVEQYTRGDANTWTLRDHQSAHQTLRIESIGVSLPLAHIYRRVEFPE